MSTIKYKYTYTEYQNFPRASSVSHTLASIGFAVEIFLFLGIIISVLILVAYKSLSDLIAGIMLILAMVALMVFMKRVYPKIADRIVQKVIEDTIQRRAQAQKQSK